MACNDNVVKNIASEITRTCQAANVGVDQEFVVFLIHLLLLNPKYGKLISKSICRKNLEIFVNECVERLKRGDTSINTLKMQFVIHKNYDNIQNLIDKHLNTIDECLRPLLNEILDEYPEFNQEAEYMKLFRKISIYIILASGLGNPGLIITLKEGMKALESVFSLDDLHVFVALPREEKNSRIAELIEIVSGVRLFNRDCEKGGDGIPDLPFNLVDVGKACLTSLSNNLITVMQRVNSLTTAIEDSVWIQEDTGNVFIKVKTKNDLTENDYKKIYSLLTFNRQYEVLIRHLLSDVETIVDNGTKQVEKYRIALEDLHAAVKYKAAVPVATVFPLFAKLWRVWRSMQNLMYLVSHVDKLMSAVGVLRDHTHVPGGITSKMLSGKTVVTDQDRMSVRVSMEEKLYLGTLGNYESRESWCSNTGPPVQFLGFCALCLCVGALVPCNLRLGLIKFKGKWFGFCSSKMAIKFSKDPQRYANEILEEARNNPQLINLLNIIEDVYEVKNVENLVTKISPKIKVHDKDIQTETHPMEGHIEKNYSWDLWKWKRRACQWANIVNCKTHSTQTTYSHLRSEIQCQTVSPRDKSLQTKRDAGMNTATCNFFIWGLRGKIGDEQSTLDMVERHSPDKLKAQVVTTCALPCLETEEKSPSVQRSDEAWSRD